MPLLDRMKRETALKFHDELALDHFSEIDIDLAFYSFIRAAYYRKDVKDVLDYGAGRNRYEQDFDPAINSCYIRELRDLRFGGATVTAADVDPDVMSHPTSHRQVVIDPKGPLPFADESFDLIVSDYVFEHVENAQLVAGELQRVLRTGGFLFARTPNKYGYVKMASAAVPNRLHHAALKRISPQRKERDTFPTYYRLNSKRDLQRHFSQCEVAAINDSWEPAYFFGKPWLYRLLLLVHKLLPKALGTASIFILKKRG
ncbi:MAG: class I SAM-dependent methyltransferase [Allosphingosinicella sp.]|uniref:class I SAM-dependent methyltransferase n=1 Tax=Allosphingosinicella sp. TaxID=2823234 RepID=UPI00393D41E2